MLEFLSSSDLVRSPRVWELAALMEVRGASWEVSPKLDLQVKMHTFCSIFVEIEYTNDKYKHEYKCKCHVSCTCCSR
jgi:hypothetical protein